MITNLTYDNFDEQTAKGLKLIDFSAQWCVFCQKLKPELEALDKIWIGYVDADDYPDLTRKFHCEGYPTMVVLKDGKEVDRILGYRTKEEILETIMKHLV